MWCENVGKNGIHAKIDVLLLHSKVFMLHPNTLSICQLSKVVGSAELKTGLNLLSAAVLTVL